MEVRELAPASDLLMHQVRQLALTMLGALQITVSHLFYLAAMLMVPLMGIWVAELNADHAVINQQGSGDGVRRGLGQVLVRASWWRRILFWLSHPPMFLRNWMINHRHRHPWWPLILLLLLFPIGYLLQLVSLHIWAGLPDVMYLSLAEHWSRIVDNTLVWLTSRPYRWLLIGATIAVWPLVVGLWQQLFLRQRTSVDRSGYRFYMVAALPMLIIFTLATATSTPQTPTTDPTRDDQDAIIFSEPIVRTQFNISTALVLATNVGMEPRSAVVRATFERDGQAVGTAMGSVNGIRSGERRGVLLVPEGQLPTEYDSATVEIAMMLGQSLAQASASVAEDVVFGQPSVDQDIIGMTIVRVDRLDTLQVP